MANTKKGKGGGGWGGRTIPPPDPWWKKLWSFPTKLGLAIATALGVLTTYGALQPGLVIEPQLHPSDIPKTELVLKNAGPFALEDVEVDLQFLWLELPDYVVQAFTPGEVFVGEKIPAAESIQPKDYMQIPLPLLIEDPDLMGANNPGFPSIDGVKSESAFTFRFARFRISLGVYSLTVRSRDIMG